MTIVEDKFIKESQLVHTVPTKPQVFIESNGLASL